MPDGRLHSLGESCRIGRIPEFNDLVLEDRAISGRHAIISEDGRGYVLVDQQSTNGTTLNGIPVNKPVRIKDGDEIRLARAVGLRFRCTRAEPVTSQLNPSGSTVVIREFEERDCWLLLADVVGFSQLINQVGNVAAVQRLQAWISEMLPLLEGSGATINRYVGDAIFAYWPRGFSTPAKVLAAVHALDEYRSRAPVNFRFVLHRGIVFAAASEFGDELTGQDVNLLFRAEKIAKRLECPAMLSQSAVQTLNLEGKCDTAGHSAVEGIEGHHAFFHLPRLRERENGNG